MTIRPAHTSSKGEVAWWQRLTLSFVSLMVTLLAAIALEVIVDYFRQSDFHWGNAGEEQLVGYFLIMGGLLFLLPTFVLFATPLVLLWPVRSQLKHWYWMVAASLVWPPIGWAILMRRNPFVHTIQFCRDFAPFEVPAVLACSLYLLLLRSRSRSSR